MMRKLTLLAAALLATVSSGAQAAITVYTSEAAFTAAANPGIFEDFNAVPVPTQFRTQTVAFQGFSLTGVGPTQAISTRNQIELGNILNPTPLARLLASGFDNYVELTFDAPTTAFGATFRSMDLINGILVDGQTLTPFQALGNPAFFGFTSTNPLSSIRFVSNFADRGRAFEMDNVYITSAVPMSGVPEPATWMMMILGFGLIGATMRQRKSVAALA